MRARIVPMIGVIISMPILTADAHIRVWHTAEALTPNAYVDSQGSTTSYLQMRCDHTLGDCRWRIRTELRIEDGNSHDYSVWLRDTAGSATTLIASNTITAGSIYDLTSFVGENLPNGRISQVEAVHTGPNISFSNTVHFMNSFDLTATGNATSGDIWLRAGSSGFQGFDPSDPGDPFRRIGFDGVCCIQPVGFPGLEMN